MDGNAHRLNLWLDEIYAEKGAEAAWRCMMDVVEYHVPKLARKACYRLACLCGCLVR